MVRLLIERGHAVALALALSACSSGMGSATDGGDGGSDAAPSGPPATVAEAVPLSATVSSSKISAPVDVVRDEWGIPHVYGSNLADVTFAQGYTVAQDRIVQMDLLRRNAEGSLAELVGGLSDTVVDGDINMRIHHLRSTSQAAFDQLKASVDPDDQRLVASLGSFAAGVNAYVADLKAGTYSLPPAVLFLWAPSGFRPWNEVDSILLLNFETFYFNYSAGSEIFLTQMKAAATRVFDSSQDPRYRARSGIFADLTIFAPVDPTYTIPGWTGMNGDTTHAESAVPDLDGNLMALLDADRRQMRGIGRDWLDMNTAASNNWVVAPKLTQNGNAILANDTHVPLQNPSIWYLIHLNARGGDKPFSAMGEAVPGVPTLVLGMNDHVAWGATTDQVDQTDVYQETVVNCDGGTDPCVMWNNKKVALVPRVESFGVGKYGVIDHTVKVTIYDVPHHGPILPRVTAQHGVEPLGGTELSVRYVGYEPYQLVRAANGLLYAKTMNDFLVALDRDNKTAAFNWVVADDSGNIGWTEAARIPRRPKGNAPWFVMPGDGSAEWVGDLDPKYIPHAYNPDKGWIATSNNDPIGTTDDGDPFFGEPLVDGLPLYLTWDYVDGARAGRIAKRMQSLIDGGKKITLDDMQAVQADAVSEYGQLMAPTLIDALTALVEEAKTPGAHPSLAATLAGTDAATRALLPTVLSLVKGWTTFDTPSGVDEDNPTPQQVSDSQATLIFHTWIKAFSHATLDDELSDLMLDPGSTWRFKLLLRASLHPEKLASGISKVSGDANVFDKLGTVSIEGKLQTAAAAAVDALSSLTKNAVLGPDPSKWRWGQVHTLTLDFLVPMGPLKIPLQSEAKYPHGFPRHGAPETVDPGGSIDGYTYAHGPGIRFVCELDPKKGPIARNALPGGETFDTDSPHYRDQMELWRKNKTFDLAFQDADVIKSAMAEYAKNNIGRIRFTPTK